jgi:hypothetical protein
MNSINNEITNFYELEEMKPFLKTNDNKYILDEIITERMIKLCEDKMMLHEPNPDCIISIGNIKNINNSWKNNEKYLSENYDELECKNKYLNSRINIYNNKIDKPPEIEVDNNKNITFKDGRHRFSNFRDLEKKTIPIIINKNNIEIFKKNNWIE